MRPKRSHKQDKLAKVYDAEILPIWAQRFGRMMLRDLTIPPKARILDVGCGTGYPALDVIKRMDEQGQIIAIDPSSPMLDVARVKAGALSGKRIFFRSESAEPRLAFADDVYDLVLANLSLLEMLDPPLAVREFARVTRPGGKVIVTFPLAGTFSEFYDIFREVLIKKDRALALTRLDEWLAQRPTRAMAQSWFERAGLVDVTVEEDHFTLLFRSSREFFFAPLIDYGELSDWKQIAGKGPEMQEVFWEIKEAIDAYFGPKSFNLSVVAGCVRARNPLDGEAVPYFEAMSAPDGITDPGDPNGPRHPLTTPTRTVTNQIVLGTGEIEVVSDENDDEEEEPESIDWEDRQG